MKKLAILISILSCAVEACAADDFPVSFGDGRIVIQNVSFFKETGYHYFTPQLSFLALNKNASEWSELRLKFQIDAVCNGKPRQWTESVALSDLGSRAKSYTGTPQPGELGVCSQETFEAVVEFAENEDMRTNYLTGEVNDLKTPRLEAKKRAEEERKAEQAEIAREQAEFDREQARLDREQRQRRTACARIYRNTADKKISDLTVKEDQLVKACQGLGYYSR